MTAATVYEQIAAYYCAIMHAVKVSSHKSCIITTLLSRRSNGMTLAAMSGFEPGPPMDVRMAEWSKAPDSRWKTFQVKGLLVSEWRRGFKSHF